MAFPKRFVIKEDLRTLRMALRDCGNEMLRKRIRALVVYKEHEQTGISCAAVSAAVGVDRGKAMQWRNDYIRRGLPGLLSHGKKGNRPSAIEPHQREALRQKLHDPGNGLRGFTELVAWFNLEFSTTVRYKTLNQYAKRHFGAQCKVARKSHVKKDPEASEAFKKTSISSARS